MSMPFNSKNYSINTDSFQQELSSWFQDFRRDLPWRKSKNPYHIWISEIILQQTRVEQGLPYYLRFVAQFPTVSSLASANLDDVLKTWEGLGYYSRARNLHKGAAYVVANFRGNVPSTYDSLLSIPGVGPYTAAAIASIAFGVPSAVVDGNVIRVLSRLFCFEEDVSKASSKRWIQEAATFLLNEQQPGNHNEAMMELGATICTPHHPRCTSCPVSTYCSSLATKSQLKYPVKKAGKSIPHLDIAVGVIRNEAGHVYVQRRLESGMLGGLWEFPGGKNEPGEPLETTCEREIMEETGMSVRAVSKISAIKHAYSHFKITLHAYECVRCGEEDPTSPLPWVWAAKEQLADYAFPKANRKLIREISNPTSDRLGEMPK